MSKLDFDGRIVCSREDDDVQRRKGLAKAMVSTDSTQTESQTCFPPIRLDDNTEVNNLVINSESGLSCVRDEYGNEIKYDSNGDIRKIIVTPIKID